MTLFFQHGIGNVPCGRGVCIVPVPVYEPETKTPPTVKLRRLESPVLHGVDVGIDLRLHAFEGLKDIRPEVHPAAACKPCAFRLQQAHHHGRLLALHQRHPVRTCPRSQKMLPEKALRQSPVGRQLHLGVYPNGREPFHTVTVRKVVIYHLARPYPAPEVPLPEHRPVVTAAPGKVLRPHPLHVLAGKTPAEQVTVQVAIRTPPVKGLRVYVEGACPPWPDGHGLYARALPAQVRLTRRKVIPALYLSVATTRPCILDVFPAEGVDIPYKGLLSALRAYPFAR